MKSVEQLKLALKSGEYDGVDLMQSWCTMENQQKQIAELTHALNELYEQCDNFMPVLEQLYWKGEVNTGQFEDLRAAFKQADKLLEGN